MAQMGMAAVSYKTLLIIQVGMAAVSQRALSPDGYGCSPGPIYPYKFMAAVS